jgi:hypothetical protein
VEQPVGGREEELVLGRAFEVVAAAGAFVVKRAESGPFHDNRPPDLLMSAVKDAAPVEIFRAGYYSDITTREPQEMSEG